MELLAPPSKSHALRALAAAAVRGAGVVRRLPDPWPHDLTVFVKGLETLGVPLRRDADAVVITGPIPQGGDPVTLHAHDGGAPARFLLAVGALSRRSVTVAGSDRLSDRPMEPLLEALRRLGATVTGGPGLPATVRGPLVGGRRVGGDGRRSSQFLSALLLVSPAVAGGVAFDVEAGQVSGPYLDLTRAVMADAGVQVDADLEVPESANYGTVDVAVEGDWSGATALLAVSPFVERPVLVSSLNEKSLQPDREFLDHLMRLGLQIDRPGEGAVRVSGSVLRGGTFNLSACPDVAPALAAVASLAPEPVRIEGAGHLRLKESDRIETLVAILTACGVAASSRDDGLEVRGPIEFADGATAVVNVRGDHRMVMAAALVGLRRPVWIDDAGCVSKSFPGFFRRWPGALEWRDD